jgi:hypothetical protein
MGFERLKIETMGFMALESVCWHRYIEDEKNEYIPTINRFLEAGVDIMLKHIETSVLAGLQQ